MLNKPSGTAVHGGSGLSFGVIEGLRALRPEARFLELVHRLDRDTSGILLVAKKRSALRSLHEQLREKECKGLPGAGARAVAFPCESGAGAAAEKYFAERRARGARQQRGQTLRDAF